MIFDCDILEAYDRAVAELHESAYEVEVLAEDVVRVGSGKPVLGLMATAHGEEPGGIYILHELIERMMRGEVEFEGSVIMAVGNRGAYERDVRYLERDLNRCYGVEAVELLEEKRAVVLRDIFKGCDFVVDLHQTVEGTRQGFFIIPDVERIWDYVKGIGPGVPVVAMDLHGKVSTLTSFMVAEGKLAATLEMGSGGMDAEQMELAMGVVERAIGLLRSEGEVGELGPVYRLVHHELYGGGAVEFKQAWRNFDAVEKGDKIVQVGGEWVEAPQSGYLLLYPRKWFGERSHIEPEGVFAIVTRG